MAISKLLRWLISSFIILCHVASCNTKVEALEVEAFEGPSSAWRNATMYIDSNSYVQNQT
jgi:hypothetical protein